MRLPGYASDFSCCLSGFCMADLCSLVWSLRLHLCRLAPLSMDRWHEPMVLESIERLTDGSPTECKINQNQQRNNWNGSQCGFPDDSRLLYGRCPPLSSRPHTACASKSLGSKVQQVKGGILFDGFFPNMFTCIWVIIPLQRVACLCRMILLLSGRHDSTCVSRFSPASLPLVSRFVSHLAFHFVIFVPQTGLLCDHCMGFVLLWTGCRFGSRDFACLPPLVSHLSPTVSQYALGALGRIISTVASPSRCCAPHDATCISYFLVSHCFPIPTCLQPVCHLWLLWTGEFGLSPACFPFLFVLRLAWDGKHLLLPLSFHLSPTAVPFLGLPWDGRILFVSFLSSACVSVLFLEWKNFTWLPLVSHFPYFFPTSVFALWPPWSPACFRIAFVLDLFFSTYGPMAGNSSTLVYFFGGTFSSNLLMTLIHQGWWAQSNGPSWVSPRKKSLAVCEMIVAAGGILQVHWAHHTTNTQSSDASGSSRIWPRSHFQDLSYPFSLEDPHRRVPSQVNQRFLCLWSFFVSLDTRWEKQWVVMQDEDCCAYIVLICLDNCRLKTHPGTYGFTLCGSTMVCHLWRECQEADGTVAKTHRPSIRWWVKLHSCADFRGLWSSSVSKFSTSEFTATIPERRPVHIRSSPECWRHWSCHCLPRPGLPLKNSSAKITNDTHGLIKMVI